MMINDEKGQEVMKIKEEKAIRHKCYRLWF